MHGTYLRLDITAHDGWRASFVRQPTSSPDRRCATPSVARLVNGSTARCSITTDLVLT